MRTTLRQYYYQLKEIGLGKEVSNKFHVFQLSLDFDGSTWKSSTHNIVRKTSLKRQRGQ